MKAGVTESERDLKMLHFLALKIEEVVTSQDMHVSLWKLTKARTESFPRACRRNTAMSKLGFRAFDLQNCKKFVLF
jgi:hypothetical protein